MRISAENDMQTPRDLLPAFYRKYQLGDDGGQSRAYVKVELTKKISLYFPNFDARRKAIFKHDVHHMVTGYTSTFKGETEIGAWEIGSGCRQYWAAFILDIAAITPGMLINAAGVYKAFVRGRRTKNLYADLFTDEQVMDMPITQIKKNLLLDDDSSKTNGNLPDVLLFVLLLIAGVIYSILSILVTPFILLYTVYIILKRQRPFPS